MTTIKPPPIDERTYAQLLAEVTARIPVHNPEWRNHNDSDPGMTLLQLWAFMSENLLYQTRLVPDRVRAKYLELLGIDVPPATAAAGVVTFDLPRTRLEPLQIPEDREVLAGRVPFRTTTGLTALPVEVVAYVKRRVPVDPGVEDQYRLLYGSLAPAGETFDYYVAEPVVWGVGGTPPLDLATTVDGAVWLAVLARKAVEVDRARELLGGQEMAVGVVPDVTVDHVTIAPRGTSSAADTASLEFHLPDTSSPLPADSEARIPTYVPLRTSSDQQILVEPGIVQITLPASQSLTLWGDLEPNEAGVGGFPPALEGEDGARLITWIRVRPPGGGGSSDPGRRLVRLTWLGANAALVQQRARIPREQIGVGTGLPDQRYRLANVPVLPGSVRLTVDDQSWTIVDDLMEGGPEVPTGIPSTVSTGPPLPTTIAAVSRADGEVRFGDGLHGARPRKGAAIVARYDVGGGRQGMVGVGSIAKASFLPAGAVVANPLPTWGGGEAPTQAEAEQAMAAFVRHHDRMVAADDFRDVVRSAPGVEMGRVEVLPLVHPDLPAQQVPGAVTLLLLPAYDPVTPDSPVPDQAFLRTICEYVEQRRLLTTELHLRGPVYEPVWVSIGIDAMPGRAAGPVREDVKTAVRAFLSPLVGGHLREGWPLLTPVNRLELFAVVARVDGVAKVFDVLVSGSRGTAVDQVPMDTTLHLPQLRGLEVRQGDPLPIADLQGSKEPGQGLPVPAIPGECC
ncbi:putative phage baseplate assembly protein [Humibacillus xanthopallidus]|uniref:Putative phage baseplate assembly protein n=1 Tax=Humibacillus xanthopallidus TaxID=412689 RepID=A0A543PWX1_9MICO|nr:hypothetical protein [Humibacillus xanthopallidus]TQN48565.1 putative phage baseplate assembly protein [Humibacillus xanthopallidus]